jgi:F0F1-type ATP synthase assembly protein I
MKERNAERGRENKADGSRLRDIAKYTGLAFQMGLIILLGALAGKYLDRYFELQTPVFTLVLSLVSVFAALYISLKDFLFKGK